MEIILFIYNIKEILFNCMFVFIWVNLTREPGHVGKYVIPDRNKCSPECSWS